MEAPERKQLVLGAKINRLGKCKKDNPRDFIEMIYTLIGHASTGGFNLKPGEGLFHQKENVEDEQFM